jgi:hypothetical protein
MPTTDLEDPRVKLMRKWSQEMPDVARDGLRAETYTDDDNDARSNVGSVYSTQSHMTSSSFGLGAKGRGWNKYVVYRSSNTPRGNHSTHQHNAHSNHGQQNRRRGRKGKGRGKGKGKGRGRGNRIAFVNTPTGLKEITKEKAVELKQEALAHIMKWNALASSKLQAHPWVQQNVVPAIVAFQNHPSAQTYNNALESINAFQLQLKSQYGVSDQLSFSSRLYNEHMKQFSASADGKGTYVSMMRNLDLNAQHFVIYLTSKLYNYVFTAISKCIYERNAKDITAQALKEKNVKSKSEYLKLTNPNEYRVIAFFLEALHPWYALLYRADIIRKAGSNSSYQQNWKENEVVRQMHAAQASGM